MFPNIRLLILALFTSIVALTCGFGVFAAFRVNHEPLSRLPADTTPLQLVADEPAAPDARRGPPLGVQSPLSEAQIGRAAADAPEPASPRRDPPEPPNWSVGTDKPGPTAGAAQRQAAQPTEPSAAVAPPPLPASTAGIPAPTVPMATAVSAPAQQTPVQTRAVQSAPDMVDAAGKTAAEPAKAAIPAVAAIEPGERRSAPTVAPPVEITGTPPETAPPQAKAPEKLVRKILPRALRRTARKAIERRRVALRKRVIGTPPAAAAAQFGGDNATFREPVFQSAPNSQPRNDMRPRSARKTANGSFPSSPTVWPNDE